MDNAPKIVAVLGPTNTGKTHFAPIALGYRAGKKGGETTYAMARKRKPAPKKPCKTPVRPDSPFAKLEHFRTKLTHSDRPFRPMAASSALAVDELRLAALSLP